MWNIPSKQRLDRIPRLYETELIPLKNKEIYLHFFIGGCDWYICYNDSIRELNCSIWGRRHSNGFDHWNFYGNRNLDNGCTQLFTRPDTQL